MNLFKIITMCILPSAFTNPDGKTFAYYDTDVYTVHGWDSKVFHDPKFEGEGLVKTFLE